MSRNQAGNRIQVPNDLREVLLEFTISYLLEQPGDVVAYAADYFQRLRDSRTTTLIYATGTHGSVSPEESTLSGEEGKRVPCSEMH